jgi:hypothetical protein
MPTPKEAVALTEIMIAAEMLERAYEVSGGAENRRDQLKTFMTSIFNAAGDLAHLSGADALVMVYDLDTVMQSFDDAFIDAVDAEEASEPRINPVREWGTYNARAL